MHYGIVHRMQLCFQFLCVVSGGPRLECNPLTRILLWTPCAATAPSPSKTATAPATNGNPAGEAPRMAIIVREGLADKVCNLGCAGGRSGWGQE